MFILAKVVVDMKKVAAALVDVTGGDNALSNPYLDAIDAIPSVASLCTAIFDADGNLMGGPNGPLGMGGLTSIPRTSSRSLPS